MVRECPSKAGYTGAVVEAALRMQLHGTVTLEVYAFCPVIREHLQSFFEGGGRGGAGKRTEKTEGEKKEPSGGIE